MVASPLVLGDVGRSSSAVNPMLRYQLSPHHEGRRLTPREILARFSAAFPRVEADIDDPDSLGRLVTGGYEEARQAFLRVRHRFAFPLDDPPPVEEVEQTWCDAACINVWLGRDSDQGFNAVVTNSPVFDIVFTETVPAELRYRTTYHVASLLGYCAEIVDEPDALHAETGNADVRRHSREWWKFW